jgi:fatty acid desaturase
MAVARRHLTMHLLRCTSWCVLLVVAVALASTVALADLTSGNIEAVVAMAVVAGAAAMVFIVSFAFFHDAAHGALGLPNLGNDLILFVTSAPMMMSGHGQRQLHLRHHAHPLTPDDLEGKGANTSLLVSILEAPLASLQMRAVSFVAVPPKVRPWVAAENALNVVVTLALLGMAATGVWSVAVVLATWWLLQLTMNAWASHVPHRAPVWLMAVASRLVWTGSPVVLSLVYHLEHHAHPRVPCATLGPDLDLGSPLLEQQQQRALSWAPLQPQRPRPSHVLRGMG